MLTKAKGGLPTQQPGTVFKGKGEELGNCYLGDQKTPAVWNVTADYAYCGEVNSTDSRWRD